jgi:HAD superfamily hydrolase (TIGR01450 family)
VLFLDFDESWRVYLGAERRLPPTPPPPVAGTRRISGVLEIAEDFDLIVLDAYGVLHEGAGAHDFALRAFSALRALGKPVCVVTNAVTHGPDEVARRLTEMGFPLTEREVISGRSLLPWFLRFHGGGKGFAVLGYHPEAVVDLFPGTRVGRFEAADLDAADGFILVDTNMWTDATPEEALFKTLKANPRPVLVCNPDVTCPYQGALSYEPGFFAFRLGEALPKLDITFLGKPYPAIYDLVTKRFKGIPRDRILAVGDSPHTDVLGARGAGMTSLLVESGLLRGRDSAALLAECGIIPDFIAETI